MRRRCVSVLGAAAGALLLAGAPAAWAGPTRLGESGFVTLPRSDTLWAGRAALGMWGNVTVSDDGTGFRPSPLAVGVGLARGLDVAFSMGTRVVTAAPDEAGRPNAFRLGVKHNFVPEGPLLPGLAVRLSGRTADSLRPDLGGDLVVQRTVGGFTTAAVVGYRGATGVGSVAADTPLVGLGTSYQLTDRLELQVEAWGEHDLGEHRRVGVGTGLAWRVLSRRTAAAARVERRARLLARMSAAPTPPGAGGGVAGRATRGLARELAGLTDVVSLVVSAGGDLGGDRAPGATVYVGVRYAGFDHSFTDTDDDGIEDRADSCPYLAEDLDDFEPDDGCPEPDNDGDGILDGQDRCPDVAGIAKLEGCSSEGSGRRFTSPRPQFRLKIQLDPGPPSGPGR